MKRVNFLAVLVGVVFSLSACTTFDFEHTSNDHGVYKLQTAPNSFPEKYSKTDQINLKSGKIPKMNIKGSLNIWSDPIGVGSVIEIDAEGEGTMSHLGKTKIQLHKIVNTYSYPEPPQPWNAFGEIVLTSASGDELYFFFENCDIDRSNTPEFIFKTNCNVTGGTGRFKDATGSINYRETYNWSKSKGMLELSGNISF